METVTTLEAAELFCSETLGPAFSEAGAQLVTDVHELVDAYRPAVSELGTSVAGLYMQTTSVVGEALNESGVKEAYAKLAVHVAALALIAFASLLVSRWALRVLRWFLFPPEKTLSRPRYEQHRRIAPGLTPTLPNLPSLRPAVGAAIPEVLPEEAREAAKQGLEFVAKGHWRGQLACPLSTSKYELRFDHVRRAFIAHVDSPGRLSEGSFRACWGGGGLNWHPSARSPHTATSIATFHAAFLAFVRAKCNEHGVSTTGPLVQRRRWAA